MQVLIHRGSNEIGGTCIQLSTDRTTILLDLGLPLSKESKQFDLSSIKADAIIISHPHQDHYGLIDAVDRNIPVYIGKLGKSLIDATRVFIGEDLHKNNFQHFEKWHPFMIGDFVITPYLVDHSSVDAYGFLIEAEGKRVFYSGDFRAHGRKSELFERMVKEPLNDIDILFMEGTMMKRNNDEFPTEESVETRIFETIRGQENISFLISSSQNIDRIVSAFRACKRAGKTLVIDFYTAWVLEQMKRVTKNVPSMEWDYVKVYADHGQDQVLQRNGEYFGDFRKRVYNHRIEKDELTANPAQYLYFARTSKFRIMELYKGEKPVNVIYSQWLGYLKCSNHVYYGAEEIAAYQHDRQVNFVYAHTSGHAILEDLQRFAGALKPKMLVPIHTEYGAMFQEHFENVVNIEDRDVISV